MNGFFKKGVLFIGMGILTSLTVAGVACDTAACKEVEMLTLDVISYEDLAKEDHIAMTQLKNALLEKGIVGIKSIPEFAERLEDFIDHAKEFSSLPFAVKEQYSPNREAGDMFGYELGKERFRRTDGSWAIDDSKASYYALVPNSSLNKWPVECDLQTPFLEIGRLMFDTGKKIISALGISTPSTDLTLDQLTGVGRMLHYKTKAEGETQNPLWCGAHFDHGLITALLPAFYFANGKALAEPSEAGLFIKIKGGDTFYKVPSDDKDVMLFQVGEFGQLVMNDTIQATEHRVHKAKEGVERYTMALFINPSLDTQITSYSELVKDSRYGAGPGEPCVFRRWHEGSLNRYLVKPVIAP